LGIHAVGTIDLIAPALWKWHYVALKPGACTGEWKKFGLELANAAGRETFSCVLRRSISFETIEE